MIGWIITGIIAVPFVVMAVFLLNGRGSFLIAGFNTMSDEKRAEYDEKALCKAVGWLLLLMAIFMLLFPLAIHLDLMWLFWLTFVPFIVLPFAFVIYANTGNRFKKPVDPNAPASIVERKPMSRGKKLAIIIAIVISAQLLIAIGISTYRGERDPKVSIVNNSIRINALYGTDISFDSISEITLLQNSMREIGVGTRTNGYATSGQALKGTFQSSDRGPQLLFVFSSSSPTIHISKNRGVDVYISFRDSETTRSVYQMLSTALANR